MDIKQLVYFLSVAKSLNISAAASENYITQPAMSRQIISLEHELGVRLLDRTPKGIVLTSEGLKFMMYAQDVIDRTEQMRIDVHGQLKTKRMLKILIPIEREKLFAECANAFSMQFPDVLISVDRIRRIDLDEAVRSARADVYFIWEEEMSRFPELKSVRVKEARHCLVIRRQDIAAYNTNGIKALNGTPFGSASPTLLPARFKQISLLIEALGIQPASVTTFDQMSSALIAARSNLLNCIVPEGLIADTSNILVVPLNIEESKMNYFAAYRLRSNPLVDAFITIAKARENIIKK